MKVFKYKYNWDHCQRTLFKSRIKKEFKKI